MMRLTHSLPRAQWDAVVMRDAALTGLRYWYCERIRNHVPTINALCFATTGEQPPANDLNWHFENLLRIVKATGKTGNDLKRQMAAENKGQFMVFQLFQLTCAYIFDAEEAINRSTPDQASAHLFNAFLHLGMAMACACAGQGGVPLQDVVADQARSNNAHASLAIRNAPYRKAEAEACRLVREKLLAGARWESAAAAAREIGNAVAAYLKAVSEGRMRFSSEEQRDDTIADWLRNDEFLSAVFASARTKKDHRQS